MENDETVDWIVSLSHRPYQTEQYIGDIYPWVRERGVPMLSRLDKYVLHIGAHHHNYVRGQLKDAPVYHMISGGTAWEQYWGYGKEENYDDVQKTISQWCYQLIDVDLDKKSFSVETYSIGSVEEWMPNVKVDEFHRIKDQAPPEKLTITSSLSTEEPANLEELTLIGSHYVSPLGEEHNSTQFQVSKFEDFSVVQFENYRHYEDLYGMDGRKDKSKDLMAGVDIFKTKIHEGGVEEGVNYARVRYRDRNLNWSEWSDPLQFIVGEGGADPEPKIEVYGGEVIPLTGPISLSYMGAKADKRPWIGLYRHDAIPGLNSSLAWYYAASDPSKEEDFQEVGALTIDKLQEATGSGSVPGVVKALTAGRYKCLLLHYEGSYAYKVDAETPQFYIGPVPTLRMVTDLPAGGYYNVGNGIKIELGDAPELNKDVIHIFRVGDSLHLTDPLHNKPAESVLVKNLSREGGRSYCTFIPANPGYYYAAYYVEGSPMVIGNAVHFQVGDKVGTIKTDKASYKLNEPIVVTWSNTPGIAKDWIGIYKAEDIPEVHSSDESGYSYTYFDGVPYGTAVIGEKERPKVGGKYFAAVFTNDSYTEVTNRAYFEIEDSREVPSFSENSASYTYGDVAFEPVTVSNGKPLTLRSRNSLVVEADTSNPAQLNIKGVGEAKVLCSVEGDEQYQPASTEVTVTVDRAKLRVRAKDVEKVYDGEPYSADGGLQFEGFVYGEDASVLFGELAYRGAGYGATNAGKYGLMPYGLQAFNYAIEFQPGTLYIMPAPVEGVTLTDQTFAYDGKPHRLEVSGTLPEGAMVVYENNDKIDPGVYTVTAKIIGGSNYENLTLTATLTITGAAEPADDGMRTAVESVLSFSVAPNPATDVFSISTSKPGRYVLFDYMGRTVRSFTVEAGETVVNLNGVLPGLYILKGETGQGVRLVVQ